MSGSATSNGISTAICKASPAELAAVGDVLEWMSAGHDAKHIQDAIEATHAGVDGGRVLTLAVDALRADASVDRAVMTGWGIRCYRDIYRRQMEIGDFDGARKSLKELLALAE